MLEAGSPGLVGSVVLDSQTTSTSRESLRRSSSVGSGGQHVDVQFEVQECYIEAKRKASQPPSNLRWERRDKGRIHTASMFWSLVCDHGMASPNQLQETKRDAVPDFSRTLISYAC